MTTENTPPEPTDEEALISSLNMAPMREVAIEMNENMKFFIEAGFTEEQAFDIIGKVATQVLITASTMAIQQQMQQAMIDAYVNRLQGGGDGQ